MPNAARLSEIVNTNTRNSASMVVGPIHCNSATPDYSARRSAMESRPGDTYSFRVLPGRDPEETFNGTLIDHEVGNVEDAQRIVTASASSFAGLRGPTGVFDEGESEETHDTSSRRRLVQRCEGDDGEHAQAFCQNCIAGTRPLSANSVDMYHSTASDPAFRAAIWPKSSGSNARRTARGWLSRLSAIPHGRPPKALGRCFL